MKFQQQILNCKVVGVHQSFQIFKQNTWFLENSRGLSKFFLWDFTLLNQYYQIITKTVHKKQFYINNASRLKVPPEEYSKKYQKKVALKKDKLNECTILYKISVSNSN